MKLDNYQMLEAFRAESWRAAIMMLRQHYGLLDYEYLSYEVLEHPHNAECVEVRQDNMAYYWHECYGFKSERKYTKNGKTYIYCRPPVRS